MSSAKCRVPSAKWSGKWQVRSGGWTANSRGKPLTDHFSLPTPLSTWHSALGTVSVQCQCSVMCGIIGYIGAASRSVPILVEGLRRLEYRGYDSAGIALVNDGHARRAAQRGQAGEPRGGPGRRIRRGRYGLGHTRWATHGRPTEENAHPHRDCTGRIVVVHNGIIENYLELKADARRARATGSSPKPTPKSSRTWSSARCGATGSQPP